MYLTTGLTLDFGTVITFHQESLRIGEVGRNCDVYKFTTFISSPPPLPSVSPILIAITIFHNYNKCDEMNCYYRDRHHHHNYTIV